MLSLPQSCSETLDFHPVMMFGVPGFSLLGDSLTVHVSGCRRRRLLVTLIRACYLPAAAWTCLISDGWSLCPKAAPNSEVFNPPFYLLFWAWTRMSAWSSPVKVKKKKKIVFQFWVDSSDYNQLLALKKVTTRWRRHWSLSVIVKGALPEDYTSE